MDVMALAIERANPQWNKNRAIGVLPLVDHIVGAHMRSWMLMLLGAVGIVLLIACANIANLLLARASARQREVGIRATLGAGRWRLVRQLLIESLVLSMVGTALAVVAASWGIQILRSAIADDVPRVAAIAINLRVLLAAALLSLVTGVLFGIVPALQSSRVDLDDGTQERRSGQHRRRQPAIAAPVRGRGARAGGRAGRRRVALHRQLRVGDAHRSRLRPRRTC